MVDQLAVLEEAWRATAPWHEFGAPATEAMIVSYESRIGRSLPRVAHALLTRFNGVYLVDGNLSIDAIEVDSKWELVFEGAPAQVLPFGSDGSDAVYCFWCDSSDDPAVLEVRDYAWQPGCVGVAASSLTALLKLRTAYYTIADRDMLDRRRDATGAVVTTKQWNQALDALLVPRKLRDAEPDDELYAALHQWCDPAYEATCSALGKASLLKDVLRDAT